MSVALPGDFCLMFYSILYTMRRPGALMPYMVNRLPTHAAAKFPAELPEFRINGAAALQYVGVRSNISRRRHDAAASTRTTMARIGGAELLITNDFGKFYHESLLQIATFVQ